MSDTRKNIKLDPELFADLKADKPDHMDWPGYLQLRCLIQPDLEAGEAYRAALEEGRVPKN